MALFPSPEWVEEMRKVAESDPEYKKAGADWEGDMIMVIEAEPGKLDQPFMYYSKPYKGEMLEYYQLKNENERTAEYTIRAPYSVIKGIIKGEIDPLQAMMKGKIKVKGNMQKLLKYAKFQQLGMKALAKVKTEFVDEVKK
ncbi:MAG: SCP2 sterol-binding domain-containing protein [Proteobacteria bacterium]|jgi:putative sterol carrier protein|nr:SCP2 sterol-binding domain-containing protein [Pseudomonadota bacterium]